MGAADAQARIGQTAARKRLEEGGGNSLLEACDVLLSDIGAREFADMDNRQRHTKSLGERTLRLLPLGVLVSLTILFVGLLILNDSLNGRNLAATTAQKLAEIGRAHV